MKKTLIYALVLGTTALGSLQAEIHRTAKLNIPFEFHVANMSLPAGEYRLQQNFGSEVAILVNTHTGQRIQMLRPSSGRKEGRVQFKFTQDKEGYTLKLS